MTRRSAVFIASVCTLLLSINSSVGNAQERYFDQWIFGKNLGIDFRSGTPTVISSSMYTEEGSASICDPSTGELLFYTNGVTVWNRKTLPDGSNAVMLNGDDLWGSISGAQSSLIVPYPEDPSRYYIITADAGDYGKDATLYGINYSIVDMRGDNGLGEVVTKNDSLLGNALEMLVGVRRCDGGFWVIGHESSSSRFFAWAITPQGLQKEPVISDVGNSHVPSLGQSSWVSILKASPDGRYLVAINLGAALGEVFRFDSRTGQLTAKLDEVPGLYGASFSPNSRYLYVPNSLNLVRYTMRDDGTGIVPGSELIVKDSGGSDRKETIFGMQIAPDGKIYFLSGGIGYIERPDEPDPFFKARSIPINIPAQLPNLGLPNCIDGYFSSEELSPSVEITASDMAICPGETVDLKASGADSYFWSPATGLSCPDCPDPVASPTTTTTYRVIGTSSGGCTDIDSITIVLNTSPIADAGVDAAVCEGKSLRLGSERTSDSVLYFWSPADGLDDPRARRPVASVDQSRVYRLRVVDSATGCESYDSVLVAVVDPPVARAGEDQVLCASTPVRLGSAGAVQPDVVYAWSPETGLDDPKSPRPVVITMQNQEYVLRALDTTTGCESYDTVLINVWGPATISTRIGRDYHGESDELLTISVESDTILPGSDIRELLFDLEYDYREVRLDVDSVTALLAGTMLEGWDVEIGPTEAGQIRLRFIAPAGEVLKGGGTLFRFQGRPYLGRRFFSELPFSLQAASECLRFRSRPGLVRLDTICGLNLRLIESSLFEYAAPIAIPNPSDGLVRIKYSLGLDGPTTLEIYDVLGNRVAILVNEYQEAGEYAVEWDGGSVGSGTYWMRLRSGDWKGEDQVIIN